MSGYTEACLDALALYDAAIEHNHINARNIINNSDSGELLTGLLTLVGALLQSCAAASGCTEADLRELLRAMWLDQAGVA